MLFEYSYYIQTDFDRNTKRPKFLLWLNKQTQTLVKDECRDQCPKLSFIEKMNVSLFRHLDSTVYYWLESNESNNSSNKGFLLWFVIDGQPLYCFRPEEDTFANEVRLGLLYDNDSKVILFQRSTKDKLKPYIVCSDPTNAQTLALTLAHSASGSGLHSHSNGCHRCHYILCVHQRETRFATNYIFNFLYIHINQ